MNKDKWNHPDTPLDEQSTRSFRSMGDLEDTTLFRQRLEREFLDGESEMTAEQTEVGRREFVKLMGASSALAGLSLASCRRPESYIIPHKEAPVGIIPGKPLHYATALPRAEGAVPVVVTTYEGRPTKIEPNRDHPDSSGTDTFAQASVLDLYSPSRSRKVLKNGEVSNWEDFEKAWTPFTSNKAQLAVVVGGDDCPTRNRILKNLGAKVYSYETLISASRTEVIEAAFGAGARTQVDFTKAKRILSLDCDFLSLDKQGETAGFYKMRQGGGEDYKEEISAEKMNRLYMVEGGYSITGGMADHRLRVVPSRVAFVAAELAKAVGVSASVSGASDDDKIAICGSVQNFDQWITACANDLKSHAGQAVVLAGRSQPKAVQQLALAINQAIGAMGSVFQGLKTDRPKAGTLEDLIKDINGGKVENILLLTSGNPIYDTPTDLKFAEALSKAKVSIHLGLREDATAKVCTWHLPASHTLESWSDARSTSGLYSVVQPMILPLYGGVSELDVLVALEKGEPVVKKDDDQNEGGTPAMEAVKESFLAVASGGGDAAWKLVLKEGFAKDTSYAPASGTGGGTVESIKLPPAPTKDALEVEIVADASIWDGRYVDNAWLQEAPDPITKLSWDNAALVSPKTANELGLFRRMVDLENESNLVGKTVPATNEGSKARAPFVSITVGNRKMEIPVIFAFGQADNVIRIAVGYGQAEGNTGLVGQEGRGFDANLLRSGSDWIYHGGKIEKSSRKAYPIAFVQEHHSMYGRALAREISTLPVAHKSFSQQLEKVKKQGMDSHAPENIDLYKPKGSIWHKDDQGRVKSLLSDEIHQWGMSIDLNTCTGCNACLVACQAENNIPVVGKKQVAIGREMHWIRVDRYFAAQSYERDDHGHIALTENPKNGKKTKKVETAEWVSANPAMIPQPVACTHCESAPCETVCPVNATVHSEEGINGMAYNRCIGTRYCADNCPYKARRFNFFDYNKRNPLIKGNLYKGPFGKKQVGEAPHLQKNPNVTVRMRGVMEKCTYCIQRIEKAKIKQKQVTKQLAGKNGGGSVLAKVTAEDLRIKPNSVRTACQDTCPAEAISFGNLLAGTEARINRAKASQRSYDLLNYINTRPRTSYLARVKNPNLKMPDAKYVGLATIHTH